MMNDAAGVSALTARAAPRGPLARPFYRYRIPQGANPTGFGPGIARHDAWQGLGLVSLLGLHHGFQFRKGTERGG